MPRGLSPSLHLTPLDLTVIARDELQRAERLVLEAVALPTHLFWTVARANRRAPQFKFVQTQGRRVFIHPATLPFPSVSHCDAGASTGHRRRGLEPQHEIGLAILTLRQEVWLGHFPGVAVNSANLGGSVNFALERPQRIATTTATLPNGAGGQSLAWASTRRRWDPPPSRRPDACMEPMP